MTLDIRQSLDALYLLETNCRFYFLYYNFFYLLGISSNTIFQLYYLYVYTHENAFKLTMIKKRTSLFLLLEKNKRHLHLQFTSLERGGKCSSCVTFQRMMHLSYAKCANTSNVNHLMLRFKYFNLELFHKRQKINGLCWWKRSGSFAPVMLFLIILFYESALIFIVFSLDFLFYQFASCQSNR